MPNHDYRCPDGHIFERFVSRDNLSAPQTCECGKVAEKVFLCFPMAFVQPDIHYDSPIDGRPITSKAARQDDLARNGCVEYDPAMKQDAERKQKERDEALDKSVDQFVDQAIATMPARKREKLAAEMEGGLTVEPERMTFTPETGAVSIY